MSNQTLLRTLRSLLASLYPEETSARRLVADAGLDASRITFNGQAINTWHAILSEAVKTERLQPLLNCVQAEYGANPVFQVVHNAYVEYAAAAGRFVWPLPPLDGEEPQAPGVSPYKGLHYFDTGDAALFFGRERLTADLVVYLRTHRFLAVVGASGSGKSSLVRAGLVPALRRGEPLLDGVLPPDGSNHWHYCIMTPTAHPLEELAAKLTHDSESVTATATLLDDLWEDTRSLHLFMRRLVASDNRLLLVVDQFEELFTLCRDPSERQAFINNLLTAAVDDGATTVVITLRADFYVHCFTFDNLRDALEGYQKNIGLMQQAELRQAIEKPAQQEGWDSEPGLVDLLLHDVGDEPGALPLLSHALLETWKRRRGRTLTLAGYVESGRVQGAIAHTAESVFTQRLTPEQQMIAKNIFLRLTELGEGTEGTRRRVQLVELMPQTEGKATIETVLRTLADARLVTTDKDEVEIAHEALIRNWPTLRRWLDENREGLRIHRRLTEATQEWETLKRDRGALYRGLRLQQALEWESRNVVEFSSLEKAFLAASKAMATRQRRRHQWAIGISIVAGFLVIVGLSSWLIIQQRKAAIIQQNQITYQQLRNEATAAKEALNPDLAIQKLGEANAILPDQFALGVEVQSIRQYVASAWLVEAAQFKADLQPESAIAKLTAAHDLSTDLLDLDIEVADVRRHIATAWVQQGEQLVKTGNYEDASAKFWAAINLKPPSDATVYVWIKAGELTIGSTGEDKLAASDEMPTSTVSLHGFWIGRTEVTNSQYIRCVEAKVCSPPNNNLYRNEANANHPVKNVDWYQAKTYAEWRGGKAGRLPSEAEWEMACRGKDSRIYPWGDEAPNKTLANYYYYVGTTTQVGDYPADANGLYDMAGNLWEWTNSEYRGYPYDANDGREKTDGNVFRTLRGGSWDNGENSVRCMARWMNTPDLHFSVDYIGFRMVMSFPGF